MGKFKKINKKIWTKNDLLKIADNEFERNAIESEFDMMPTSMNSAGERVIDFRGDEVNGTWLLMNLQSFLIEHFIDVFMSERGYDGLSLEDAKVFHEHLTTLLGGLYL